MKTAEKHEETKTLTDDEEELANSGFAENSDEKPSHKAEYGGEEEELAYTGYASAGEAAHGAEVRLDINDEDGGVTASADLGTYGDEIIDEFSVEANVHKVSRITRLPEAAAKYIMGIIYIGLGAVCAAIPVEIEHALPYVVGGLLCFLAVLRFIYAIAEKEYVSTQTNKTASSIILLGVGIMIIIEHEWAHMFIPIVWGVWGLFEGAHAFNHAISRIVRHKHFLYYIIKGITEVVVAFLLLYKPEQYGELHIIVFGVSLILDGIVVLPFVHKFVTRA